jgi:hypothetical protein
VGLKNIEFTIAKNHGNNEIIVKPFSNIISTITILTALGTVIIFIFSFSVQMKSLFDTVDRVNELEYITMCQEVDINTIDNSQYDRDMSQIRMLKTITRYIMPQAEAESHIKEVEKELKDSKERLMKKEEESKKRIREMFKK